MEQWQIDALARLENAGYIPALRQLAMSHIAPFWWSTGPQGNARVLHNGTMFFVHTGERLIGITAEHVYRQYLEDKETYGDVDCQVGSAVVEPENYLIDRDRPLDLVTFGFSEIVVNATTRVAHNAIVWPPPRLQDRQAVIYGGYPGVLRKPNGGQLETPFQSFIWAANEITAVNIILFPDFQNLYWHGHDCEAINENPGGISGGPVFRIIEGPPVDRLELVGITYEYLDPYERMRARHADCVLADGHLVRL